MRKPGRPKSENKIVIKGDLAFVYANKTDHVFIIDAKNVERIRPYTWCSENGYAVTRINSEDGWVRISMHRLIMNVLDEEIVHDVDHINHCRNDNREANLRHCKDDAHNSAHTKISWWNHEQYWVHRTQNNTFVANISNGVYENVQIEYLTFNHLLKDREFLYQHGLDAIGYMLHENKKVYIEKLNNATCEEERELYHNQIKYIESKQIEAEHNLSYTQKILNEIEQKGIEIKEGGFYPYVNDEGQTLFLFKNPKKSKDVTTGDPLFKFIDGEVFPPRLEEV